ncbi:hypothetical protein SAG0128_08970 [Streptococcus agalactiae STIR-CD-24]|nr:hypothetical protein A964_0144 [Streptococcus agalactiae GD201008-001]EIM69888.1 hypothetical protein WY5_08911 [Streptococcus agalactiae ZQ0910]EPU08447.1 hypothetical protein SAG0125_06840 [Streptococcus agalactiae STIR-CD-21]EPU15178.1 hypothetical protein SAG0128_08970 [Streptococcus agalactiae STIR-CD-24]
MNILVVDDEDMIREGVAAFFERRRLSCYSSKGWAGGFGEIS